MIPQSEKAAILQRLLTDNVPGKLELERVAAGDGPLGWQTTTYFTLRQIRDYGELRLEIVLRGDGDIDVQFLISGHAPDRVEAHFVIPEGEEREALEFVSGFVGDFVEERIVLGYDDSHLRGGREFIPVEALTAGKKRTLKWAVSWLGTYDW